MKIRKTNLGMPDWLSILIITGGFVLMTVFDSQMDLSLAGSAGAAWLITVIIFALVNRKYQGSKDMPQEERLDLVKKRLQTSTEITNKGYRELTGVSEATATRDMDELEKQGVVEQVGKTGKYVKYRLK